MRRLLTMRVCTGSLHVYEDLDARRGPATFVMLNGEERIETLAHGTNARAQIEALCLRWKGEGRVAIKLIVHPASADYVKRDCAGS